MAEKRKRRAKKLPAKQPAKDVQPCKLDFKTVQKIQPTEVTQPPSDSPTTTTPGLDASKKITDPKKASQKAQQLLDAQRSSVEMLTQVRKRVELLPAETIQSALEGKGYFVMDGFLEFVRELDVDGGGSRDANQSQSESDGGDNEGLLPFLVGAVEPHRWP